MIHFLLGIFIVFLSSEMHLEDNYVQNKTLTEIPFLKQKQKRLEYLKHFELLDSVVKANPYDTIYCCYKASVEFMVRNTKIEVSTDANIAGRSSFSKSDLERWLAWFEKKYKIRKVRH
jgi:hypothetical protein